MKRTHLFLFILSFFIIMSLAHATDIRVDDYMSPTAYPVGSEFDVDVYINESVVNLIAWDFRLSWDPSVLNLTDFTNKADNLWVDIKCKEDKNVFSGFYNVGCNQDPISLEGSYTGPAMDLATFRFKVLEEGISPLNLTYAQLRYYDFDNTDDEWNITEYKKSGTFNNSEPPRSSNLRHEPIVITTLDLITIFVDWFDFFDLQTVIIWENSTGEWQGHTIL